MAIKNKALGEILIEMGAINQEQLDEALRVSKSKGDYLGETLLELGSLDEKTLFKGLEYIYHIPYTDLSETVIDSEATGKVTETLAKKYLLIPVKKEGNVLSVVMSDPLNFYAIDDVKNSSGLQVTVSGISSKKSILSAIDRYYGGEVAEKAFEDLRKEYGDLNLEDLSEISDSEVANAPVVRLINSILQRAIKANASDIHIEPMEDKLKIRFRIDGQLQEVMTSSMAVHSAIVTRIKIMSLLNISEKRVPQDGRVDTVVDGKQVDLRISILPTVYGEKVVIRILGGSSGSLSISELGFSEHNLELFSKITASPNGIILISGPTGSGKTTTLYSLLRELNKPNVNIITVEDPVEYKMEGVNQVQVNVKADLTFATGLRSILRQDPDIIMIGEIRDTETAEIAIRASITGHLVLSTIHTNDAASSVTRLVDMGIEPFLVSSSMVGVVAQRLVRKICPRCKTAYRPTHSEMLMLDMQEPQSLYKGEGCAYCNFSGYKGRVGIHEILVVTKEIRELINRNATLDQIQQMAVRQGTVTLSESCKELVLQGVTTMEEMLKVTYRID
jgi:type IV pilus assembly protein PilB